MRARVMLVKALAAAPAAFLAAAIAIPPGTARAAVLAPSPEDVERARELDENARQLYDEGSYEGAIMAWERAYELTGYNNLLYNISMAYDRAGDFQRALEVLDRYRALASPEERTQLERRKKSLLARIEKKKEEEAAAAAAEDGGDDGSEPSADPDALPAGDGEDPAGGATPPEVPKLSSPTAWALTATSTVGFGLAIGFGAASLAATGRAEDGCTNAASGTFCETSVEDDVSRARTYAIVADVGIAVGAASAVALVAVLAVRAKRRKAARGVAVGPGWLPRGAGIGLAGRF